MPSRTCVECGKDFWQDDGKGRPATTCSDECRTERARRRALEHHHANYVAHPRIPAPQTCTVPGCDKPNGGAGLCAMHRRRLKVNGTLELPESLCSACGKPTGSYGVRPGATCKDCRPVVRAEHHRAWVAANPEKRAAASRRARFARYGLTPDDFDAILVAQGGACAICRKPYDAQRRQWHIDHDQETGFVRGVLCRRCNQDIGRFEHDPVLLRAAADYLVRARLAAQETAPPM